MSKFVAVFVISFVVIVVVAADGEQCQEGCSTSDIDENVELSPLPDDTGCIGNENVVSVTCLADNRTYEVTCKDNKWSVDLNQPCDSCSTSNFEADSVILKFPDGTEIPSDFLVPIDQSVSLACNESYPYELRGSTSAECMGHSEWKVTKTPECVVICNELKIVNGETIPKADHNSTATVTCSDGYELSGNSTGNITCQMDGTWSVTPQCESGTIRFAAFYWVTFFAVTLAVSMSHQ